MTSWHPLVPGKPLNPQGHHHTGSAVHCPVGTMHGYYMAQSEPVADMSAKYISDSVFLSIITQDALCLLNVFTLFIIYIILYYSQNITYLLFFKCIFTFFKYITSVINCIIIPLFYNLWTLVIFSYYCWTYLIILLLYQYHFIIYSLCQACVYSTHFLDYTRCHII